MLDINILGNLALLQLLDKYQNYIHRCLTCVDMWEIYQVHTDMKARLPHFTDKMCTLCQAAASRPSDCRLSGPAALGQIRVAPEAHVNVLDHELFIPITGTKLLPFFCLLTSYEFLK